MLIKNCNNIKSANIALEPNNLNIKYAANGTGKSTIAKAIHLSILPDGDLKSLTPFGMIHEELEQGELPSVTGLDGIGSVSIFNDRYLEQFVFKQDEVLANSFQIFVKNSDYDIGHAEIDEALNIIKDAFAQDASIEIMLKDLTKLIDGFGKPTKKSSFSAASPIGKGIAGGNKIENIPPNLAAYTDFFEIYRQC
jgi:energy-coupling factor transporter ATP-binding protein EcfA2